MKRSLLRLFLWPCLLPFSWSATGQVAPSAEADQQACFTQQLAALERAGGGCDVVTPCHDPSVRDLYAVTAGQSPKVVKTIVHILRETDGSNPAATPRDVAMQFHHLNLDFAPAGIQFTYVINYIDDSAIRTVPSPFDIQGIMSAYATETADYCNIFVGTAPVSLSFYPWISVGYLGIYINDLPQFYPSNHRSTLTHEMGHALGLYHTFTGYDELSCGDACAENMGAMGDGVGDYCADTPPQKSSFNPGFTATTDACTGIPFAPIAHTNYMSYSDNKRRFTPQQAARMHCYLSTDPKRMDWLDASKPAIPYVYTDSFGYSFVQDTLADGEWLDISSRGIPVSGLGDDNIAGPFSLGFELSFYGSTYDQIYIGSNGYASFLPVTVSPGTISPIPTADANNALLAPFLADLNLSGSGNPAQVTWFSNGVDSAIINFEQVPFFEPTLGYTGSNTFQIVIATNGEIPFAFHYQDMEAYYPTSMWLTPLQSMVGIESPDGKDGLEVNNYQVPGARSKVLFRQPAPLGLVSSKTETITVFPVPANEVVYVQTASAERRLNLLISDPTGRTVWHNTNYIAGTPIPVQGWAQGIYCVSIITPQGLSSRRLVLAH